MPTKKSTNPQMPATFEYEVVIRSANTDGQQFKPNDPFLVFPGDTLRVVIEIPNDPKLVKRARPNVDKATKMDYPWIVCLTTSGYGYLFQQLRKGLALYGYK